MVSEREDAGQSADAREPLFRQTYDWSDTAASMVTLNALGTLEDVHPVDLPDVLGTTLYDHVDPDALDTLVAGEERVNLWFSVDDYLVEIAGKVLTITRQ